MMGVGGVGSLLCCPFFFSIPYPLLIRLVQTSRLVWTKYLFRKSWASVELNLMSLYVDLVFGELTSLTLHRLYSLKMIFDGNLKTWTNRFLKTKFDLFFFFVHLLLFQYLFSLGSYFYFFRFFFELTTSSTNLFFWICFFLLLYTIYTIISITTESTLWKY